MATRYDLAIQVGGINPLSHFRFEYEQHEVLKAYFIQLMLEQGFLASNLFYAMHAHSEDHVQGYLEACDRAFAKLAEALDNDSLLDKLDGQAAKSGFRRLT